MKIKKTPKPFSTERTNENSICSLTTREVEKKIQKTVFLGILVGAVLSVLESGRTLKDCWTEEEHKDNDSLRKETTGKSYLQSGFYFVVFLLFNKGCRLGFCSHKPYL